MWDCILTVEVKLEVNHKTSSVVSSYGINSSLQASGGGGGGGGGRAISGGYFVSWVNNYRHLTI